TPASPGDDGPVGETIAPSRWPRVAHSPLRPDATSHFQLSPPPPPPSGRFPSPAALGRIPDCELRGRHPPSEAGGRVAGKEETDGPGPRRCLRHPSPATAIPAGTGAAPDASASAMTCMISSTLSASALASVKLTV